MQIRSKSYPNPIQIHPNPIQSLPNPIQIPSNFPSKSYSNPIQILFKSHPNPIQILCKSYPDHIQIPSNSYPKSLESKTPKTHQNIQNRHPNSNPPQLSGGCLKAAKVLQTMGQTNNLTNDNFKRFKLKSLNLLKLSLVRLLVCPIVCKTLAALRPPPMSSGGAVPGVPSAVVLAGSAEARLGCIGCVDLTFFIARGCP